MLGVCVTTKPSAVTGSQVEVQTVAGGPLWLVLAQTPNSNTATPHIALLRMTTTQARELVLASCLHQKLPLPAGYNPICLGILPVHSTAGV